MVPFAAHGAIGTATVTGRVWHDLDGDAVDDAGEPGFEGVTVRLHAMGTINNHPVTTKVTDSQGTYTFSGMFSFPSVILVDTDTLPPGLAPTYDFDGVGTSHRVDVVPPFNSTLADVDFGYGFEHRITVDSPGGFGDGDGCSLGEAIENANANAQLRPDCASGAASLPADVVEFAAGVAGIAEPGLPVVTDPIRIAGPGAKLLTLAGAGSAGILRFSHPGFSFVEGLTMKEGGYPQGAGGALSSQGASLMISGVRLVGNRAHHGGAVSVVNGDLFVYSSEIAHNRALPEPAVPAAIGAGGGIYVLSTVAAARRVVSLKEVTLSGNDAQDAGGALAAYVADGAAGIDLDLEHVTVAGNTAGASGGGLHLQGASGSPPAGQPASLAASLIGVAVGDNEAPVGPDLFEVLDVSLALAYSVVETTGGYVAESSTESVNADPGLRPLSCNGGPTRTHLLASSSPAIDRDRRHENNAIPCGTLFDQRGAARGAVGTSGFARCDSGALELHFGPPVSDHARGSFFTLTPCRVVDTRLPDGPNGGPSLSNHETRFFPIAGNCGVPSTAVAVVVNVTATGSSEADSLLIYEADHGAAPPGEGVAIVAYPAGRTRANNAVVSICPTGTIAVRTHLAPGTVDFILDVVGYYD